MTRNIVYLAAVLALCWPALGFAQSSNPGNRTGGTAPGSGAKSTAPPSPQPAPAGQINSPANSPAPNAQNGQPQAQPNVPGGQAQGQVNVPGGVSGQANAADGSPIRDNQWRYKWHNGRWWYWTPANNWVVYLNNAWRPYTPGMFDSGYYGTSNYGTYYTQPYSGYRNYYPYGYSYRSYPYYGGYGYRYSPSIGFSFGAPRYYSGYRGFGGYGNRGGVSIGIGGGFY